ncbi:MAG: helix-turn-helix transcriptional regulator [Bacteroidota bacterium]
MSDPIYLKTITQAHQVMGLPAPKHPLISVFYHTDPNLEPTTGEVKFGMDLYMIGMKDGIRGTSGYGRSAYDFQEGTMIFVQPNQILVPGEVDMAPDSKGWTILFHPDLIRSYPLGQDIGQYSFFAYESNEALHLSNDEKNALSELVHKIEKEYNQNIDKHTEELIVINLASILKYCKRYYDRQFYTRTNLNKDYTVKFEQYLKSYFDSEEHLIRGLPTVSQCGEALNMSGHYLSDLLKIETGKGVLEHIHLFVIEKAKTALLNSPKTVREIAYELGFEYSQNFSRLFKAKTGMSPRQYRTDN